MKSSNILIITTATICLGGLFMYKKIRKNNKTKISKENNEQFTQTENICETIADIILEPSVEVSQPISEHSENIFENIAENNEVVVSKPKHRSIWYYFF